MKHLIKIGFFAFFVTDALAQIGGISGSKLNSVCVDVVDHHKLEFEPSFSTSTSNQSWDKSGKLQNTFSSSDSVSRSSGVSLRFTYGLFDKLEVGVTLPIDASSSSWGARYVISQSEKLGFAAITGLNIPMSNSVQNTNVSTEENTIQYGFGAVVSYHQDENLSYDFNVQYNNFMDDVVSGKEGSVFLSAGAGYYVFEHQLQFITGLGYQSHSHKAGDQSLLTFYPGVTIETGKNYIVVLNAPIDLSGKNMAKSIGFGLALTLTFE